MNFQTSDVGLCCLVNLTAAEGRGRWKWTNTCLKKKQRCWPFICNRSLGPAMCTFYTRLSPLSRDCDAPMLVAALIDSVAFVDQNDDRLLEYVLFLFCFYHPHHSHPPHPPPHTHTPEFMDRTLGEVTCSCFCDVFCRYKTKKLFYVVSQVLRFHVKMMASTRMTDLTILTVRKIKCTKKYIIK